MLGFKENEGIASFSPANNLTCLGPGKTKHKSFNFSFSTANEEAFNGKAYACIDSDDVLEFNILKIKVFNLVIMLLML